MTLYQIINKLQGIDIGAVVSESIDNTLDDFIEENKAELLHGFGSKGKLTEEDAYGKIGPAYYKWEKYAEEKFAQNPLAGFGIPDLNRTGNFFAGFVANLSGNVINETSTNSKTEKLEGKYQNIFGLGADYKADYLEKSLGPQIRVNLTYVTGLKFR